MSVQAGIARQVEAEGVKQVVVLSDPIEKYDSQHGQFPAGTECHDRRQPSLRLGAATATRRPPLRALGITLP